jgi:hypothetical protein
LLITILSFFFLDSTNIAAYPSWETQGAGPGAGSHAPREDGAGEDPLPLMEPGEALADGPCACGWEVRMDSGRC